MPYLILSSRFTTDSQLLRQTAQRLGWETLRHDGKRLPDWFEPADDKIALFYTAPHVFSVAAQLSRVLMGCDAEWLLRLPHEFLSRRVHLSTLEDARHLPGRFFAKHALCKSFPAAVYDAEGLAQAAAKCSPKSLLQIADRVTWEVEYRCFVLRGAVAAMSVYRRGDEIIQDHVSSLGAPQSEVQAARDFCQYVLQHSQVATPPAVVIDVGIITGIGWAVVESNQCWASGIYACDPVAVLECLVASCVPHDRMNAELMQWDFQRHYVRANPPEAIK